jgi:hypothetical protein
MTIANCVRNGGLFYAWAGTLAYMFGLGHFELIAIGCLVLGLPMIGIVTWFLVTQVDWKAINDRRACRQKKLKETHSDAEQGG